MMTLVLAETEGAAKELCAGARSMGDVVLATFDDPITGIADKCEVVTVPADRAKEDALETFYKILKDVDPQIVFAEPTRRLKTIVGRMACREGASVQTNVNQVSEESAKSMYFGGVGTKVTKSLTPIAFCTVSAGAFSDEVPSGTDVVEQVDYIEPKTPVKLDERKLLPPADVDLTAASRIVAAGRGFAAEEELGLARTFCERIGAELGCTRPLTESENWFPREAYIGVSGLILSPDVYVGIGVSGQMQHMVGVDNARVSFAINKDPNAPIFDKVDYGLVGEITDVLPQINDKLA